MYIYDTHSSTRPYCCPNPAACEEGGSVAVCCIETRSAIGTSIDIGSACVSARLGERQLYAAKHPTTSTVTCVYEARRRVRDYGGE